MWQTSDMRNWVSSGRQRHVDPVHSRSAKGQRDVVPIRLGGDEIPFSRADAEAGKSRRLRSGCLGGEIAVRRRGDAGRNQPQRTPILALHRLMDATVAKPPNPAGLSLASDLLDFIGGLFAVIEPDLFATPVHDFRIQGLQVVELYGIGSWTSDNPHPVCCWVSRLLRREDNDVLPEKKPSDLEDREPDSANRSLAHSRQFWLFLRTRKGRVQRQREVQGV